MKGDGKSELCIFPMATRRKSEKIRVLLIRSRTVGTFRLTGQLLYRLAFVDSAGSKAFLQQVLLYSQQYSHGSISIIGDGKC